ncbi:MAG TPA: GNAT family N-acetyltransferase [Mycobacteriales bacterium]|nr:GNAT family N-acetyltransferase [Mycobacteriales bacterium]
MTDAARRLGDFRPYPGRAAARLTALVSNITADEAGPDTVATAGRSPSTATPVDVVLATGAVATIRAVRPEDRDSLRQLYERTGRDSMRLRFFSFSPHVAEQDVVRITRPASDDHIAELVTSRGEVIGVGCVERTDNRGVGDIALLVDDTRHGEGVGMLLVEHLVDAARRAGFHRIRADVLAENVSMMRVFQDLGANLITHYDSGVIEVDFPVTDRRSLREASERRESIADHASIGRVLAPRSVVVIGAGHRPESIGHRLLGSIRDSGYQGEVSAINHDGTPVGDVPAWTAVEDLPYVPDLAIIAVPAIQVPAVIADCARVGVEGAVIISDGFAELGDEGKRAEREILLTAREAGMRLIGPNCLGIVNTAPDVRLNATFSNVRPAAGVVGVASQSGGVGIATIEYLNRRNIGVSNFVSLGNKADVSGNDLLLYWEHDPSTQVCLLYLESFGNARKFARIAARVSRQKPIVAITAGRSRAGARGVRSHTAAAATPAVALDALFRKAGVIGANAMGEAIDIVALLERSALPRGRRVAVLTNGGGPGALAADACAAVNLDLPELSPALRARLAQILPGHAATANPIDTTAGGSPEVLAEATRVVMASDEVDSVMVVHTSLSSSDSDELAAALSDLPAAFPTKTLIGVLIGKAESLSRRPAVPVYDFPEPAAQALAAVTSYAEWRSTPAQRPPRLTGIKRRAAEKVIDDYLERQPAGGWLDTDAAVDLVSAYGIPVARTTRAETIEEAVAVARRVGYPVAIKAAAGEIVHRTEMGGVQLNLASDDDVLAAVTRIRTTCGETCPVVVQPMIAAGVETAVGVVNQRSVGPMVMVGLGGVATDLLADRSFRLPPLDRSEVRAAIKDLRTAPLLFGYRGSPLADVAAFEDLVLRVGRLASELDEVSEVDLNPVVVSTTGAVAVDVKVRVSPTVGIDSGLRRLPAVNR